MPINSITKTISIIKQRIAFRRQRILSLAVLGKQHLVKPGNSERKIMQLITTKARSHIKISKMNQFVPVQMNMYNNLTYNTHPGWPHFPNEPSVRKKQ